MRIPLVVATWNLWGANAPGLYTRDRGVVRGALPGSPASRELDPTVTWLHREPLLVAELAALRPDVVALQESARTDEGSSAGRLASALRLEPSEDGHELGLGALTPQPARQARPLELASDVFGYPPPLLISTAVGTIGLTVVVVHLPLARVGDREPIVRELVDRLAGLEGVLLLCGDLNLEPDDPLLGRLLEAGFVDASRSLGPTVPNPDPQVKLDYVLVRSRDRDVTVGAATTLGAEADAEGFLPSDHLGVAVKLEIG